MKLNGLRLALLGLTLGFFSRGSEARPAAEQGGQVQCGECIATSATIPGSDGCIQSLFFVAGGANGICYRSHASSTCREFSPCSGGANLYYHSSCEGNVLIHLSTSGPGGSVSLGNYILPGDTGAADVLVDSFSGYLPCGAAGSVSATIYSMNAVDVANAIWALSCANCPN